jgi:hypothetical protein
VTFIGHIQKIRRKTALELSFYLLLHDHKTPAKNGTTY